MLRFIPSIPWPLGQRCGQEHEGEGHQLRGPRLRVRAALRPHGQHLRREGDARGVRPLLKDLQVKQDSAQGTEGYSKLLSTGV